MYITDQDFRDNKACLRWRKWFRKKYPNGVELIELINDPELPDEPLFWGYETFITSQEEKEAFYKRMNIDVENKTSIYYSRDVVNSFYISYSTDVIDSSYINTSNSITNSKAVIKSDTVDNSFSISNSQFVFDSKKVMFGNNISNSQNIYNCNYVENSHSVVNANFVTNSTFINGISRNATNKVQDCHFISDCEDIKNCLFCTGLKNAEFCLFNKKISESVYNNIVRQLKTILKEAQLLLSKEWPEESFQNAKPNMIENISERFSLLPEKFWRWVRTLPGYEPNIIYQITYNKDFM